MHPLLFEIPTPWGSLPIYAYGVMLGFSLLIGWHMLMALGKRDGLDTGLLGDVFLTTAIAGIVGARLLYVATNYRSMTSYGEVFDIRSGGLVAYGGFLSGFGAAYLHLRGKHQSVLAFADPAAPAIALGLFFTRIGCYLYGCDFGARLSDHAPAWLIRLGTFPRWDDHATHGLRGSPAFLHHVDVYGLSNEATAAYPVHPTQLYEACLGLLLAVVCFAVWNKRKFQGQALLVLALAYSIGRFFVESLRDDPERGEALGFTSSQLIALLLIPVAGTAYSMLSRRARAAAAV